MKVAWMEGASSLSGLLGSGIHQDFGVKHLTTEPIDRNRLATLFRLFAKLDEKNGAINDSIDDDDLSGPNSSSTNLPSLSGILPVQASPKLNPSSSPENSCRIPREFSLKGDEQRILIWWSLDTTIELQFGRLHPREPACIRYYHDDLLEVAASRKPDAMHDL